MKESKNPVSQIPVILGPTACGKTAVAARLAFELNGEVISADSRQVYRGMDIGTGKDLEDYSVEGIRIPAHLVDIVDPGSEYNIFQYQRDFFNVFADITSRGKLPVVCGGSGMYLEAVIKAYELPEAPPDPGFSDRLRDMDNNELEQELKKHKKLHSTTDTSDRTRMIRALEIEYQRADARYKMQDEISNQSCILHLASYVLFGINPGREEVRRRITDRLKSRLEDGMVNEVRTLLENGVPAGRLKAYGLEYKFITQYLEGTLSYDEMFRLLNTAIHQFAKRQMTWFRRMERQGMKIDWLDPCLDVRGKVEKIRGRLLDAEC